MRLFIKNMVCPRCIMVVEQLLKKMKLSPVKVELGIAEINDLTNESELQVLSEKLKKLGFELLEDSRKKQIEEIKKLLIKKIQEGPIEEHFSVKRYLSSIIQKEYTTVSKLFAEQEGLTIEQYFILLRIEKVKELLTYRELTLNRIAENLGYSSIQHLSTQFKKVAGMTPKEFRTSWIGRRKPLDTIGER